jgi:hypothetical protein
MKRFIILAISLGVTNMLVLSAFVIVGNQGNTQLTEKFKALFPKKDFPLTIDSTFLKDACISKTNPVISIEFRKIIPNMNMNKGLFVRSPWFTNVFAICQVRQTPYYSAFAYLRKDLVHLGHFNRIQLHLITINKKGKRIDDKVIAELASQGRVDKPEFFRYKPACLTSELIVQENGTSFTISEKGAIIEKSGDSIVKK